MTLLMTAVMCGLLQWLVKDEKQRKFDISLVLYLTLTPLLIDVIWYLFDTFFSG